MHFNFDFTTVQVLWTFTFAALLVLLVVLLGRDRVRLFPWFTLSMALTAVRLLASRMLYGRIAPITMSEIFLTLAVIEAVVCILVAVELARRAFAGASRNAWLVGTLILLAAGGAVVYVWSPWPAWKTLTVGGTMGTLRLMQLAAQKMDLLFDVFTIGLCLLVVLFGRRFKAGWRSHTQQILIGLSTASISQMVVRGVWQLIATRAVPHSQEEYQHVIGLQEKLYNANSALFVAVVVWWIVCLWINEPGTETPAATATATEPSATDAAEPVSVSNESTEGAAS
jgi:hypothetical protein